MTTTSKIFQRPKIYYLSSSVSSVYVMIQIKSGPTEPKVDDGAYD